MADKLLIAQTPREMRESLLDSLNEASKINRDMFSMADWKAESDLERVAMQEQYSSPAFL